MRALDHTCTCVYSSQTCRRLIIYQASAQTFVRAMAPLFYLIALLLVGAVHADPQEYEHESFVLVHFASFLVLTCTACCLCMSKKTPSTQPWAIKVADAGAQCDLGEEVGGSAKGKIFVASHSGVRWHDNQNCRHLKHAGRVSQLTPRQTCCACTVENSQR